MSHNPELLEMLLGAIRPDPDYTIDQWADKFRLLPDKGSAEPGQYRTERMPYLREPMKMLSPSSPVEQIKVIKGTQLGWTEIGNNWILCTIDLYPAPMLMIMPTAQLAERHSKQKISPSILLCPSVAEKVSPPKSKSGGNTILAKEFKGGVLAMAGANSGASFRSSSYKNIFLDDVDGFPLDVDGEGSPLELAKNRADAFANRKIYTNSTPTVAGRSNIEKEFENSDQREYFVPCPECDHFQTFIWANIIFEANELGGLDEPPKYKCEHCGSLIAEGHKTAMLERGKWIAQNPGHEYVGYKLSSLYSPLGFVSWKKIVIEFLEAKSAVEKGDVSKMKRWVNTRLAEVWEENYEEIDDTGLLERLEDYNADIPNGVHVLIAGVDTQDDRLEVEVVGYGADREKWSIEYHVLNGDPALPDVWQQLDRLMEKTYQHEAGGEVGIYAAGIDMGGHRTDYVIAYCKTRYIRRIFAVKGSNQKDAPIANKRASRRKQGDGKYFMVGVNTAKDSLYAQLKLETPGAGYCHFPNERGYDAEYFKQLTGEKRDDLGRWKAKRPRVEALDCRVYADCVLVITGLDVDYIAERNIIAGHISKNGGTKRRQISKGIER